MTIGATSFAAPDTEQLRRTGAAGDFEALLISQMMRSARESGTGWLGSEDQAADAAFSMAENELARAMAGPRGFGLSKIIEQSLSTHQS